MIVVELSLAGVIAASRITSICWQSSRPPKLPQKLGRPPKPQKLGSLVWQLFQMELRKGLPELMRSLFDERYRFTIGDFAGLSPQPWLLLLSNSLHTGNSYFQLVQGIAVVTFRWIRKAQYSHSVLIVVTNKQQEIISLPQRPFHIKNATVILIHYGGGKKYDGSKTLRQGLWNILFPGEFHRRSPQIVNQYGDSELIRRSVFNTSGSFGFEILESLRN